MGVGKRARSIDRKIPSCYSGDELSKVLFILFSFIEEEGFVNEKILPDLSRDDDHAPAMFGPGFRAVRDDMVQGEAIAERRDHY